MWGRRQFISTGAKLAAGILTGCREASPVSLNFPHARAVPDDLDVIQHDRSLAERARAKGLFFGASTHLRSMRESPALPQLMAQQCGVLVPEGELKFAALRPTRGEFRFEDPDELLRIAETHGMLFRGHTLVWHYPTTLPRWFLETATETNAEAILTEHITGAVEHYRGKVHSWDVVNEAVDETSARPDKLRQSPWLNLIGPRYIEVAFHAAREADPGTMLVYNDYGTNYATPEDSERRSAILALLEGLLAKGTPIHALGIQAHLKAEVQPFDAAVLRGFLADVRQLGLAIIVTELDVNDYYVSGDSAMRDRAVADAYREYLEVALDEPAVRGIVTWGLADKFSWLRQGWVRPDGTDLRPLPFDESMSPKAAWTAIADCLDGATSRVA